MPIVDPCNPSVWHLLVTASFTRSLELTYMFFTTAFDQLFEDIRCFRKWHQERSPMLVWAPQPPTTSLQGSVTADV